MAIKYIRNIISSRKILQGLLRAGVAVLLSTVCISCVQDEFALPGAGDEDDDDVIRVRATLKPTDNTRTYYGAKEEALVTEGTFYITYPRNTVPEETMSYTKYDRGTVVFGHPEDPETGYAYFEKDGVLKDLKWRNVKGEGSSSVSLFIHNIDPSLYTISTSTTDYNTQYRQKYLFKADTNPYVASPLDTIDGKNDLIICGGNSITSNGGMSARSTTDLTFNLYHRMALLKINLDVYGSSDDGLVNLDNAKVYITNLYTNLNSVNLYYCTNSSFKTTSSSSSSSAMQECDVRNLSELIPIVMPEGENKIEWKNSFDGTYTDEEENKVLNKKLYQAQPFIFPPQSFANATARPQIIVEVPKNDVTGSDSDRDEVMRFTGYLPTVMYLSDEWGNVTDYSPKTTELTSGYVLNVTATINSPNTELTFAPVKVENWVSKSTYSVSTKKAGIYSANDFQKLIEAYQNGRIGELERYGFQSGDNTFVFQFWANVILDENEIKDQMKPGKYVLSDGDISFSFLFNGYTVSLSEGDEDEDNNRHLTDLEGQQELYKIVTGQEDELFFGIRGTQDMRRLISLCHPSENYDAPDKSELMKYGNLNSYDNSWDFYLKGDVELDFDEVFQQIDMFFFNGEFNLHREGHSITLNIGSKKHICDYTSNFDEFLRFAKTYTTYGVTCAEDFYLLTKCYNDYYTIKPELLKLYAPQPAAWDDSENKNELSWTFYFRDNMTLDGNKVNVKMVPDEENGKPKYSFYSSSPYYDVSFSGPTPFTANSRNSSYIYYVTAGSGYVSSAYGPSRVVSAYQSNNYQTLWACGKYENGAWIFSFTQYTTGSTQNKISYADFFGSMIPDEGDGKYDYNFNITQGYIKVENCPQGTSSREFDKKGSKNSVYPSDEEAFKRMADGSYWDYYELNP
ncbi:MAG: hypothetical protein J1F38_02400 [Muribaculaceae bacterium]|nr:hypothetical protein [Muribaculaceae bacterium]